MSNVNSHGPLCGIPPASSGMSQRNPWLDLTDCKMVFKKWKHIYMKQTNLHCSCNICIFIANVGTCWVINIWIVDVHLDLLHDVFEHKNSNKIVVHNQSPCLATIGMFIDNSQELTCQIKKMRTLIDFTQWLTNIFFGGVAREKQFVWTLVDISQCLKSRCGMPKSFFFIRQCCVYSQSLWHFGFCDLGLIWFKTDPGNQDQTKNNMTV